MSYMDCEKFFYGRQDELDLLKKRVLDLKEGYRHNIAFLGNRYVGKSSVLKEFIHHLDDADVTPVYLNLENKDFSFFLDKFCASLLYEYLKNKNLPLHEDLSLLMEESKKYIPHTIEVVKRVQSDFQRGKISDAFLGVMTLPEIYTNESGQFCVLFFDEFQDLEEFDVQDVFASLGNKIMTQKKCLYCLSSSNKQAAKKILSEKLSLLFGNFEMVKLEPFDLHHSQQFLGQLLEGHKISGHLIDFLTDFTGGFPLYMTLISKELLSLKALHQQDEIFMPMVTQAVENTLFDRWGVISRHFELIVNDLCSTKGNKIVCKLLIALANGHQKSEDLLKVLQISKSQLTQKLNRLQVEGVVVKNGRIHYFKDKLFKYWLQYVYQKRLMEVDLTPDKQRERYRDEFSVCIERFKHTTGKDFSSRIVDLLTCFENELLKINGRKYRLPIFKDLQPSTVNGKTGLPINVIRANTDSSSTWLIILKEEGFVETDLTAILAESKKLMQKPEKCLMISLTKPDDQTKLKALQERFWIWNEEELNVLLTLFDKPNIVR